MNNLYTLLNLQSLYAGPLLFRDADFGVQNLQGKAEGGKEITQVTRC
jgi:hypothetical protein